jgi:hypothetical protein
MKYWQQLVGDGIDLHCLLRELVWGKEVFPLTKEFVITVTDCQMSIWRNLLVWGKEVFSLTKEFVIAVTDPQRSIRRNLKATYYS